MTQKNSLQRGHISQQTVQGGRGDLGEGRVVGREHRKGAAARECADQVGRLEGRHQRGEVGIAHGNVHNGLCGGGGPGCRVGVVEGAVAAQAGAQQGGEDKGQSAVHGEGEEDGWLSGLC